MKRLTEISDAKLVALCDIVPRKVEDMVESVEAKTYSSLQGMFDKEKLDAVHFGVSPFAHGFEPEMVEWGVNLFVEKPVTLTMEDAEKRGKGDI